MNKLKISISALIVALFALPFSGCASKSHGGGGGAPVNSGTNTNNNTNNDSSGISPGVKTKVDIKVGAVSDQFYFMNPGDMDHVTVDADGNVFFKSKSSSGTLRAWGVGAQISGDKTAKEVLVSDTLTVKSNDTDPPAGGLFILMRAYLSCGSWWDLHVWDLNTGQEITGDSSLKVGIIVGAETTARINPDLDPNSSGYGLDRRVVALNEGRFTLRVEYNGSSETFACRSVMGDPLEMQYNSKPVMDNYVRVGGMRINDDGKFVFLEYANVSHNQDGGTVVTTSPKWADATYYANPDAAPVLDTFTDASGNVWAYRWVTDVAESARVEFPLFQVVTHNPADNMTVYPYGLKQSVFYKEVGTDQGLAVTYDGGQKPFYKGTVSPTP